MTIKAADERGAATFVMVAVLALVVLLGGAGLLLGRYAVAARQARSAADLSAMAGATARQQGGDGCRAAAELARANRARLLQCEEVGDQLDFVVTVRVRLPVPTTVPGAPQAVEAVAYAGVES